MSNDEEGTMPEKSPFAGFTLADLKAEKKRLKHLVAECEEEILRRELEDGEAAMRKIEEDAAP